MRASRPRPCPVSDTPARTTSPLVGGVEARDQVQQRRLAAPRRTHDARRTRRRAISRSTPRSARTGAARPRSSCAGRGLAGPRPWAELTPPPMACQGGQRGERHPCQHPGRDARSPDRPQHPDRFSVAAVLELKEAMDRCESNIPVSGGWIPHARSNAGPSEPGPGGDLHRHRGHPGDRLVRCLSPRRLRHSFRLERRADCVRSAVGRPTAPADHRPCIRDRGAVPRLRNRVVPGDATGDRNADAGQWTLWRSQMRTRGMDGHDHRHRCAGVPGHDSSPD